MDIYLIECIQTGKKYVGQCKQYLSNGRKWGYEERYKEHIRSTLNGSSKCIKLKNSILKYGSSNHILEFLISCSEKEADYYESLYIDLYDTIHPNGLNIESGGNKYKTLSDETKKKMSLAHMNHPNYLKKDSGKKISESLVEYWNKNPKNKLDHNGYLLPKYISSITNNSKIIGYCAYIHYNNKRKKVTSKKLNNDQKLLIIKEFIAKEK